MAAGKVSAENRDRLRIMKTELEQLELQKLKSLKAELEMRMDMSAMQEEFKALDQRPAWGRLRAVNVSCSKFFLHGAWNFSRPQNGCIRPGQVGGGEGGSRPGAAGPAGGLSPGRQRGAYM